VFAQAQNIFDSVFSWMSIRENFALPTLAPVLVGLGVTSLSMSASAVADVRDALAAVTLADCRELARNALAGRPIA